MGKFFGGLQKETSSSLATKLLQKMLNAYSLDPSRIDQVILGNVLTAGAGQNVARQVQLQAHLPVTGTALTINQVCGSSLKALHLAQSALLLQDAQVVVAGGTESMTQAPGLVRRKNKKEFDLSKVQDDITADGLTDASSQQLMGVTAENLVTKYQLTRQQQDEFALASHQKAAEAGQQGHFAAEIIPVNDLTQDETIRPQTNLTGLAQLPPVFLKHGSVTAGNASPYSDAAALLVLTTAQNAQAYHWPMLARLVAFQEVGYAPELMGYAPVVAIQKLLQRQHQTIADIDLFEVNEAFAAQALVVQQELQIPTRKYNISGGALALGHAVGASGARIMTTLVHNLQRLHLRRGLAALCVGGGQGLALEIECLR